MLTDDDADKKAELEGLFALAAWFGLLLAFGAAVVYFLFFPVGGSVFFQFIALLLFNAVAAVYAIFFAAISVFSVSLFVFLAALLALFDAVLLVPRFIDFAAALNADPIVFGDIVREVFRLFVVALFTGIAIAYVITALQYMKLLERVAARGDQLTTLESDALATDEEKVVSPPPATSMTQARKRHQ